MAELTEIQNHNHDGINTEKIKVFNVIPTIRMTSAELANYLSRQAIDGEEFNCYVTDTGDSFKYLRLNGVWIVVSGSNENNYFGDGGDGDVVIATNTDLAADMFYNNLTINNEVTLNPNGYRIFVKETTTFIGTGKIARNGNNGVDQTGGAALADGTIKGAYGGGNGGSGGEYSGGGSAGYPGTAGSNSTSISNLAGSAGGDGGDANIGAAKVGGTGGAGGTSAGENAVFESQERMILTTVSLDTENIQRISRISIVKGVSSGETLSMTASSGGGGGGATDGNESVAGNGGGAGGNGGIVYLASKSINTVNGNNYIEAKGGNGADGTDASDSTPRTSAGGGGGGAGGNGGLVILIYQYLVGSGSIDVSAGLGGDGGAKGPTNTESTGNGDDGADGKTGKYIKVKIS